MKPKIIKTEEDYNAALARIDELMDAKYGTPEGDELDLLSHLVELYEDSAHQIDLPTPIEAIRFRMDQQELRQKDLCPYIGPPSKVSQVLSGKLALSKSMITRLHKGLGIPLEVLFQTPDEDSADESQSLDWTRFPLGEMNKRGWISFPSRKALSSKTEAKKILYPFFRQVLPDIKHEMVARQYVRSGSELDRYALLAWRAKVLLIAREESELPPYVSRTLNPDFMRQLVQLSYLHEGPKLAKEFLSKNGIHLIVLRHLRKTFLDGAAMFTANGRPVVALTLRYDRIDSFWFTLCHELGHVALHLEEDHESCFMDDLEKQDTEAQEQDADRFATTGLIPPKVLSALSRIAHISSKEIQQTADKLRIHPAIVAGRVRFERGMYTHFGELLGRRKVRCLFGRKKPGKTAPTSAPSTSPKPSNTAASTETCGHKQPESAISNS